MAIKDIVEMAFIIGMLLFMIVALLDAFFGTWTSHMGEVIKIVPENKDRYAGVYVDTGDSIERVCVRKKEDFLMEKGDNVKYWMKTTLFLKRKEGTLLKIKQNRSHE